jgi:hypothetical protein
MDEVLGRLQMLGYPDPGRVGNEIHVNAHGRAFIISDQGDQYVVRDAAGQSIARMCGDPDEVIREIRNW